MRQIKTVLALSTALLLAETNALAESLPVFGDIYLSQTTRQEAAQKLRAKNCRLQESSYILPNGILSRDIRIVTPSCLGFPNNYKVFLGSHEPENTYDVALIIYDKAPGRNDFDVLRAILHEKYGKPDSGDVALVGERSACWNRKGTVIELDEADPKGIGTLRYSRQQSSKCVQSQHGSNADTSWQKLKNSL